MPAEVVVVVKFCSLSKSKNIFKPVSFTKRAFFIVIFPRAKFLYLLQFWVQQNLLFLYLALLVLVQPEELVESVAVELIGLFRLAVLGAKAGPEEWDLG